MARMKEGTGLGSLLRGLLVVVGGLVGGIVGAPVGKALLYDGVCQSGPGSMFTTYGDCSFSESETMFFGVVIGVPLGILAFFVIGIIGTIIYRKISSRHEEADKGEEAERSNRLGSKEGM